MNWLGSEGIIFTVFLILIILFFVFIAIRAVRREKRIKQTKPMIRFEYLDVFYYHCSSSDDSLRTCSYIVVRDINTSKLYAFFDVYLRFEEASNSLLKGKGFRKNLEKVEYGEQGSLWIDKELNNFYERDGESVKIDKRMLTYCKEKNSSGYISFDRRLYNANDKYDITLLDNTTFVDGIAEFDFEK